MKEGAIADQEDLAAKSAKGAKNSGRKTLRDLRALRGETVFRRMLNGRRKICARRENS
jgi:hypothetical protein